MVGVYGVVGVCLGDVGMRVDAKGVVGVVRVVGVWMSAANVFCGAGGIVVASDVMDVDGVGWFGGMVLGLVWNGRVGRTAFCARNHLLSIFSAPYLSTFA